MQIEQQHIDELVARIVEAVHPLRIILFGSVARGEIGPDSDVDLLVVMPDGTHQLHAEQYLCHALRGIMVPKDILVTTASDLERYGDRIGLIYRTILREGKTLYAA